MLMARLLLNKISKCGALKTEVFTQVNTSDILILNKLIGLSVSQNTAFIDDVRTVTDSQRLSYIMIGNQHPDIPFL
jgi:hypothetical protein